MNLIDTEKPHQRDKWGHPTPAALREMARAFDAMHEKGVRLDMSSGKWNIENPRRTPCCHAGAFAVAAGIKPQRKSRDVFINPIMTGPATALAKHLGFECGHGHYIHWAKTHPGLWGNDDGGDMFESDEAFGAGSLIPLSMRDIADHYRGVADRLGALDAKRAKALAESAWRFPHFDAEPA